MEEKNYKEYKQLGAYGLLINDGKILLIKKFGGPYDGKLDLPGGTIEFCETPEEAFKRELQEEVGIEIIKSELFDANSVAFDWEYKENNIKVHHTGIFYKILSFSDEIKKTVSIDKQNDDSMGADFYLISELKKSDLSAIAILELKKLGYDIQ